MMAFVVGVIKLVKLVYVLRKDLFDYENIVYYGHFDIVDFVEFIEHAFDYNLDSIVGYFLLNFIINFTLNFNFNHHITINFNINLVLLKLVF